MTTIRVRTVCFVVALACTPRPAHAQGPNNSLNARVAALEAAVAALQNNLTAEAGARAAADTALQGRVSKLEGDITADDLVGTYTIAGIQTRLKGGGVFEAGIASGALSGSMTLNGNGTGTFQVNGDGSLLKPLDWSLFVPFTLGNGNPGTLFDITWTYANGAITLTFVGFGQVGPYNVGPLGRLLFVSIPQLDGFHHDVSFVIFYRLQ